MRLYVTLPARPSGKTYVRSGTHTVGRVRRGAGIVALLIYCEGLRPTPHANNIVIAIKRKGGSHHGRSDDCSEDESWSLTICSLPRPTSPFSRC